MTANKTPRTTHSSGAVALTYVKQFFSAPQSRQLLFHIKTRIRRYLEQEVEAGLIVERPNLDAGLAVAAIALIAEIESLLRTVASNLDQPVATRRTAMLFADPLLALLVENRIEGQQHSEEPPDLILPYLAGHRKGGRRAS